MPAILGQILGVLVGVAGGGGLGLKVGRWCRSRHAAYYWVANGVVLLSGIAIDAVGLMTGRALLVWFGPAWILGGLTGLKYGLARVVGPGVLRP